MWIQSGRFHFNTDNLTFIQVTMNDSGEELRALHLHFVNERDNFTLHHEEARQLLAGIVALSDRENRLGARQLRLEPPLAIAR